MSVSKRNVAMLKRDAELDSAARQEVRRAERARQRSKSAARLAIRVNGKETGGRKTGGAGFGDTKQYLTKKQKFKVAAKEFDYI